MTAQSAELKRSTHAASLGQVLPQTYDSSTDTWIETPGNASGNPKVEVAGRTATDYEQLAVSNAVKTLTAAKYAGATHAVIAVEDAELRYTLDGTDPTTTLGTLLYVSDQLILTTAADIVALKMIRTTATDAEVNITYSA